MAYPSPLRARIMGRFRKLFVAQLGVHILPNSTFAPENAPAVISGAGAPTGTAPQGSLYLRVDGAAATTAYVNTDGGTTWAALS